MPSTPEIKPKIVIIGAGSAVFAHRLVVDFLSIPGIDQGEIALVDIDPVRLDLAHALTELTVKAMGKAWQVRATTDRRAVLPGSDYVISAIEVAGLQNIANEYAIPLKYGVNQSIGDTIGPGGLFKFLRTAPSWLAILRDIEELCPSAVVMNYTNPMSALTLLALRATRLNVVGLCHSIPGSARQIADYTGTPFETLRYRCAGINHLAWFTTLEADGEDIYPKLRAAAADPVIYEGDRVRFEMLIHFGAFPSESSRHHSEYVPYFRKRPELVARYTRPGDSGEYAVRWPAERAQHDVDVRATLSAARDPNFVLDTQRSDEFASIIVEAHLFNRPASIYANVCNTGLIDNLPPGGCVEVACLVDQNGVQPTYFGALPAQLAALDQAHCAVHDLIVSAFLTDDREAAIHALMLDPLTAAVGSPAEIRSMFDEMAAAGAPYLPSFVRLTSR